MNGQIILSFYPLHQISEPTNISIFRICVLQRVNGVGGLPRAIGAIQPIVFFILVGFSRVTARYLIVDVLDRNRFDGEVKEFLIYGAGNAGQQLASSTRSESEMRLRGFIDDDRRLDGQKLNSDKVFWSRKLPNIIEKYAITDILLVYLILRIKRTPPCQSVRRFKVHVQLLPNMKEIIDGQVSFSAVRELDIEDLLGREPVAPNELSFGRAIVGKNVLVTGQEGLSGASYADRL